MSPVIELLLLLILFTISLVVPFKVHPGRQATRAVGRLAQRRWPAVLLCGLIPVAVDVVMAVCVQWPLPAIHDEFSYLLAADTFAEGRLANPTHPLWEHFESYHIFHKPTYQSKYPPGHGFVLAAGQVLFGAPAWGNWLSVGAACAAVCWMLYGWVPPRWALAGGILASLNIGIVRYWGHNFVGGTEALLGGALLFGALRRSIETPRVLHAVTLALGLVILANTRPYEGLIASLPAAAVLAGWLVTRHGPSPAVACRRVIVPIAVVLAANFAWTGYYNHRVTGDPLRMPYQVWAATYTRAGSVLGTLSWQHKAEQPRQSRPAREIVIRPEDGVRVRGRPEPQKNLNVDANDPRDYSRKLLTHWGFYIRILLTPPLLLLPWIVRNRWMVFATVTVGLVVAANLFSGVAGHAHYIAPVGGLLFLLLVQGLRRLRTWRCAGRPSGRVFVVGLLACYAASFALSLQQWAGDPIPQPLEWSRDRARIEEQLRRAEGEHVVVVHYETPGIPGFEWVYNDAEIDASPVVWARDLGWKKNRDLVSYYEDRRIWLLEPEVLPRKLTPYPESRPERQRDQ